MKKKSEGGLSLVELLVVVTVISIVAAIAVPYLRKAVSVAENGNMLATLKSVSSTQASFYSQRNRFARLSEVNNIMAGSIGTLAGNELLRGKFVITMVPADPTDPELTNSYRITATRDIAGEDGPYIIELTSAGVAEIFP